MQVLGKWGFLVISWLIFTWNEVLQLNKREFKSPHEGKIFLHTTFESEYWPITQTVDWAADSVHHIQQSEAAGRRCSKTPTRRAGARDDMGKYAETKLGSFMILRFMF